MSKIYKIIPRTHLNLAKTMNFIPLQMKDKCIIHACTEETLYYVLNRFYKGQKPIKLTIDPNKMQKEWNMKSIGGFVHFIPPATLNEVSDIMINNPSKINPNFDLRSEEIQKKYPNKLIMLCYNMVTDITPLIFYE